MVWPPSDTPPLEAATPPVTAPVAATEEDNDRGTLVFSPTAVNVPENSSATYTVKLSAKPAATVTCCYYQGHSRRRRHHGKPPQPHLFHHHLEYRADPLPFEAAEDLDLSNGTATFRHTASGAEYAGVTGDVTATEQDNDTAGLVFSTTDVDVPEGGDVTYTVRLSATPGAPVAVGVAPASGGDPSITAAPATLIFSTTTWNAAQTVTVSSRRGRRPG